MYIWHRGMSQELLVNDKQFVKQARQTLLLYDFIRHEITELPQTHVDALVKNAHFLRRTTHFSTKVNSVSKEDWEQLEKISLLLTLSIPPALRKRHKLTSFPDAIHIFTIWMLITCLVSFVSTVYPYIVSDFCLLVVTKTMAFLGSSTSASPEMSVNAVRLLCYLSWVMSLGSLGSVAFISVNALAIQSDVTFDISNARFVFLRVLITSLFALMIALPLSVEDFFQFCHYIGTITLTEELHPETTATSPSSSPTVRATQIAMLLLPFVLGFSTSLVLMIMNRIVETVNSLLGINGAQKASAQPKIERQPHKIAPRRRDNRSPNGVTGKSLQPAGPRRRGNAHDANAHPRPSGA
jgi:hypothetical protein